MQSKDSEKFVHVADFIINITAGIEILKHTDGNIKLKIPLATYISAMKSVDGIDLYSAFENFNGIQKYDFSFIWGSLDIHYDSGVIPRDLWHDLIRANADPGSRERAKQRLLSLFNGSLKER
ncbi:MAG: hypothetical protein ACP5U1_11885 [Desulfomonilaceae bacterium]